MPPIPLPAIRAAFDSQPLFDEKSWRLSPEAWPLSPPQVEQLEAIGQACLEFHRVVDLLYQRSVENKNILRNRELRAPWVAAYLDRGKPARLLAHARHKRLRGRVPSVIRPDLLLTEEGFALTEIDSVPGGIGLTAFLNRLYGPNGGVLQADPAMIEAFHRALAALRPDKPDPMICIVVSDEAATYRPEMEWLAGELQSRGHRVHCVHPRELVPLADSLCADIGGNPVEIDVLYRFWEMFDHPNLPVAELVMDLVENTNLVVTPPLRPFQEEKLNLALFHHHLLEEYWRESLSKRSLRVLKEIVPRGWVLDPVDLPPNAVLDAPYVNGRPIHRWEQLGEASQKERNLILKLSGFHENAWGARSVLLGADASRTEWEEGIREATLGAASNLHILQEYRKPSRLRHPIYDAQGAVVPMEGRLRLCPYFFVEGDQSRLQGVLATFCPADKKIIHGMRDAALIPCRVESPAASAS